MTGINGKAPPPLAKFGAGFRVPHYKWVTQTRPTEVDFFEVVSENFMGVGGKPRDYLQRLREHYPVTLHGVGMSIGSNHAPGTPYLAALKRLIADTNPLCVSDHLCWTSGRNRQNSHDLLPIAYTKKNLEIIATRLDFIQNFLGRRLYLENPSAYVSFNSWDFEEPDFFSELLRKSGCGILLDINNLYVNQHNLGLDPVRYLEFLRADDIAYFHLAGHWDRGDVLIDTHDGHVCENVWDLYRLACQKFPQTDTLIEWDANIPDFQTLASEVTKARTHHASAQSHQVNFIALASSKISEAHPEIESNSLYDGFFEAITTSTVPIDSTCPFLDRQHPVPALTGLLVYHQAYFLRLRESLAETFPSLLAVCGNDGFSALVAEFLPLHPSHGTSIHEAGRDFPTFLAGISDDYDFGVPPETLRDLAALEWAHAECFVAAASDEAPVIPNQLAELSPEQWEKLSVKFDPSVTMVTTAWEVWTTIQQIRRDEAPDRPTKSAGSPFAWTIQRQDGDVKVVQTAPEAALVLSMLLAGKTLPEVNDSLAAAFQLSPENALATCAGHLVQWCQQGMISKLLI